PAARRERPPVRPGPVRDRAVRTRLGRDVRPDNRAEAGPVGRGPGCRHRGRGLMRVAMISEHASPLACLGGTDAGGQNVYVGQLARHLARRGWQVDVFTRRDGRHLPSVCGYEGVRVVHVPAGPPERVRKEDLLPYMGAFTEFFLWYARRGGYDLAHANFFMSALVAADARRATGLPFAVTFHALGKVRRLHQGAADGFPPE